MLSTQFIPARRSDSPWVMVVLHGLGDSIEGYRWLPAALELDWLNYLLVNAPDAYYTGYSWYDFGGNPAPGIQRSRMLLTELLHKTEERFPASHILLFGFSQGCLMSYEVGLSYPRKLAGIIGISGYAHDPERLTKDLSPIARQQRFLVTHGAQDALVPFAEVKKQVEGLQAAGVDIAWHEFAKAHTIAGEDELRVIRDFILQVRGSEEAPSTIASKRQSH